MRAAVVELGPRRSGRADRANDLVAKLDHYPTAKEHNVWKFGEGRNRILSFCTLCQGKSIVFERHAGVRFVMCAIDGVYASSVTTHHRDHGPISVEHNRSFRITLLSARSNRFACRFDRESRRNSVRWQDIRHRY
jgi:hypothetical protein